MCLIEWAQRLGGMMPPERLDVTLAHDLASTVVIEPDDDEDEDVGCNARQVELVAHGERWKHRLAGLHRELTSGAASWGADLVARGRIQVLPPVVKE